MAGYYGGRFQQQQALQQQMYQQQQQQQQQNPNLNSNNNQNARASPQQYPKHQNYQNRKASTFNENNMDAILTCDINDVYPMPEVVIFRRDFNGTNPYALKIFQIEVSVDFYTRTNVALNETWPFLLPSMHLFINGEHFNVVVPVWEE